MYVRLQCKIVACIAVWIAACIVACIGTCVAACIAAAAAAAAAWWRACGYLWCMQYVPVAQQSEAAPAPVTQSIM
eukprot:1155293-Pelagomonas_calceolata.AAC.1